MRTIWNFATSLGGSAVLFGAALGITGGLLFADMRTVMNSIAVLAVIAIAFSAVSVLRRANRQHHQINRDELDDPDPFAMRLRVHPDTDTTGETR